MGDRHLNLSHTACPSEYPGSTEVQCVAILVGRWGGWPAYTPLFIRSLGGNPSFDFHMLSDRRPQVALPSNVHYHDFPLDALVQRMQRTVGLRLASLSVSVRLASGLSAAKTNDLKPMWGETFEEDLLQGYAWWGYLQEDTLVGNLAKCIKPELLKGFDVITPFVFPLNSSGVLQFIRNKPYTNRSACSAPIRTATARAACPPVPTHAAYTLPRPLMHRFCTWPPHSVEKKRRRPTRAGVASILGLR